MENKDKTRGKTIYFICIFIIHSTIITWHPLCAVYTTGYCWENKDERDLLLASSFLRKKCYTNNALMFSLKVS